MHRGVIAQVNDWIRKNYGTTCLFVDEREHESSVMLHEQKTPEKLMKLKSV